MLLDFMRRNTRNFLIATIILIVPAFILWGTVPTPGKREKQTVIQVNKEEVSLEQFRGYYNTIRERARRSLGQNYSAEIERMLNLKQQAVDRITQEILLLQELDRLNIVVSDKEVQASLKENPAFQTDGKFDAAKWNAALGSPNINWNILIAQEREALRLQRLQEMIQSQARVTEDEIRYEFQRQEEKARIEYVELKATEFTNEVEITPDDVASYYERHKQEYVEPAQVKLAYIELKKEPSEMDFADVRRVAGKIREEVAERNDFARLAELYSDDAVSKRNGGDLGFFGKGKMVKEFEEVAFSMKPGEVSEVVRSPFGYHIIKVEETRGEGENKEVRARHILLKVQPTEDTLLSLEERATQAALSAWNSSLEQAASNLGLEVSETPLFDETSPVVPTIGSAEEITEILPGLDAGRVSDVIETSSGFYVIQIIERIPEQIPELSEVQERVRGSVAKEKALTFVKEKARDIVKKVNEAGLALEEVEGLKDVRVAEPFTRRGRPIELPFVSGLAESVFKLEEGEAAGPFVTEDAVYVVRLIEQTQPDPARYEAVKETLKERLLAERQMQVFQDYLDSLREKAAVRVDHELLQAV